MEFPSPKGRSTRRNPGNRFERLHVAWDPEINQLDEDELLPRQIATEYFRDDAKTIIAKNDSPDIYFQRSINVYRGCEHGCVYCYARPHHEYLGYSSGLDFETKILVKEDAPELLRAELAKPSWQPQLLQMSGVTDCYQPVERELRLTRRCLEVLAAFRNPVAMVTKSAMVTRDVDVLQELARHDCVSVAVAVTTLDGRLASRMEPRAAAPHRRLQTIKTLADAGIPVGVLIAPIIPGLTEHEIPAILARSAEHGASFAAYTVLRLPHSVKELMSGWLEEHYPLSRDKVLNRVREMRGGKLNDPSFGSRMSGQGIFAEQIKTLFHSARRKAGIEHKTPKLSTEHFRRPGEWQQLDLFDEETP